MADLKHTPIPVDERLSHLTADELIAFFKAYHYDTIKAKDLLTKYNISDVPLSGLRWVLKYRESEENSCPFHNMVSWQKAVGRNEWSIPFCPECKMKLWTELPYTYFLPKKKSYSQSQYYQKHQKVIKTELTTEKYLKLSFPLKVFILTWYYENKKRTSNVLKAHLLDSLKMCPTHLMKEDFMSELQKENLFIGNQYLLQELCIESSLLDQFEKSDYLLNGTSEEYFNLWWDISYHEALEYLLYELVKKNFVPQIDPKTADVLQYLIKNLSVQQSMFVLWAAIKDACSIVAENNWDIEYIAKTIPGQIKKKADRVIEGSLNKFPFRRTSHCSQSLLSKFFFNKATRLGEDGFTESPSLDRFYTAPKNVWMKSNKVIDNSEELRKTDESDFENSLF